MPVCQKMPKSYFLSQFFMSKIDKKFSKKKFIEEYQFRRPFFVKKLFFLTSIFEPLYFLKPFPIFDEPALVIGFFQQNSF